MLRQDLNVIIVILIINTIYFEPAIIVLRGYHLTSKYVLLSQTVRTYFLVVLLPDIIRKQFVYFLVLPKSDITRIQLVYFLVIRARSIRIHIFWSSYNYIATSCEQMVTIVIVSCKIRITL
jgi:hypothetical protein